MNQKRKYSLIALVAISIASVGIMSMNTSSDVETYEKGSYTVVHNSYFATNLDEQKELSQDIVKGKIVGKTYILEYRDTQGNFLDADSNNIAVTEPYIVYELVTEKSIKSKDNKHKEVYSFKVFGGELNGSKMITDVPEFKKGDKVVVLLTEAFDGKYQELVSGEFSVYKLEKGKALGKEKNLTEEKLLDKLRK